MWNLGTNSTFALEQRKTMENLDRIGQLQDLPGANWLVASNPALNMWALTIVPICAVALLKSFYVHVIWISTKPCETPAEGVNSHLHKYAYECTYICICDSLIISKIESLVVWKTGLYKVCCSSNNKDDVSHCNLSDAPSAMPSSTDKWLAWLPLDWTPTPATQLPCPPILPLELSLSL
jgi:hypothetical protein